MPGRLPLRWMERRTISAHSKHSCELQSTQRGSNRWQGSVSSKPKQRAHILSNATLQQMPVECLPHRPSKSENPDMHRTQWELVQSSQFESNELQSAVNE